jgi:uncharacterized RDD family membrane protein YckC
MPLPELYQRAEREHHRLRVEYLAGNLTAEQYQSALQDLQIRDDQGRYWNLGADSGEWYVSQGDDWVKAQPPGRPGSSQVTVPVGKPPPSQPTSDDSGLWRGSTFPPDDEARPIDRVAGLWRRVVAALLDCLVLALVLALTGLAGQGLFVDLLAGAAYFAGGWAVGGRTPAQLLLRIKVVTVEGRPPGLLRSLLRYLAMIVAVVPLGLGLIWAAFDTRKQGWHDKLAGTRVVRI